MKSIKDEAETSFDWSLKRPECKLTFEDEAWLLQRLRKSLPYYYPCFRPHTALKATRVCKMVKIRKRSTSRLKKMGQSGFTAKCKLQRFILEESELQVLIVQWKSSFILKGIDLAFGKLTPSTRCSVTKHLASFLPLWACFMWSLTTACVCILSYKL